MFKLAAAMLFSILFVSHALAANELQGQPLSQIHEMGKKRGVVIEKLNAADTEKADAAAPNRPKPSTIYLLTLNSSVIVALVHEEVVIYSSDPVDLEIVNKVLGRTGA